MSTANFYNDESFNLFSGNDYKSDGLDFSQINYSYLNLDLDGFGGYNSMDYLQSNYDSSHYDPTQHYETGHYESSQYDTTHFDTGHYDTSSYMSPHLDNVLSEPVKPFHTDYVNCESFSTRYTDGSFEECPQGLGYSMDSLTESMLKQLDTPRLAPSSNETDIPDSLKLSSLDPQMVRRLYDTCVSLNSDTDSSPDLNGMKKERLRAGRRGRRRPEKGVTPVRTFTQPRSPSIKPAAKTRPVARTGFGGLNYSWLKDSFFNCQILGNVASIAQDQTGCRMLQRQLECNDTVFTTAVLGEVLDNLFLLMTDPFGNYLCQKLMSVCDSEQLGQIITACEPQFIPICLNMHGTRAIQKLIEVVSGTNVGRITAILSAGVVELINDLNGNHVIQKCLVALSSDECEFIYKAMNEHCVGLATHRHGCCVMQRCIDAASVPQRARLVDTIAAKTLELVEDAYGNYVIQYVLRLRDDAVNARIVALLCEDLTRFSKHKFSSNVVERCLIFCPSSVRSNLVSRFLNLPFTVLHDLILDPFGNYVIQRVLNVAQPDELAQLLDIIQPHLEELKLVSSGKRIAAKISRKSSSLSDATNTHNYINSNYVAGNGNNSNYVSGSTSTFNSSNSIDSTTSVDSVNSVNSITSVNGMGSEGFIDSMNSSVNANASGVTNVAGVSSVTGVSNVSPVQDYSLCPGNLCNDYPSLYSGEVSNEKVGSKPKLNQGSYSQVMHRLKTGKDYIINLITQDSDNTTDTTIDKDKDTTDTADTSNTVNSETTGNMDSCNTSESINIGMEELSMEFPSLGSEKFKDDPLVRDFCGIFNTGYEDHYKQSYKIWSNL
ncbi:pumilio-family RNA-binding protein, putative [Theileria annulata]|uniref:Pumilio-family RNA-binding protein, putative n=1 Tax=Theileria annulata TaxID=5874 RepID=Q4UA45_THEAN|nr:pumilio-family RNA-binding protein, putative [Theileria annulata]CAI76308.1 pumilio-family RNA-binding protein, putative [Theileria annulata]|eukprot:XP_952932.1 pumilio-family RNA-binding protein, putative [Theileria annulata]